MAIKLRQSTAGQEIPLGYFLDSTDGNTEETALTIANTDIKLWKMGATTLANKNSGGATHISNGIYYAVLDATDTNTLGALVVFVHVSGALAVRVECEVLPATVYDAWIAGTDNFDVSVTQWAGTNVATPDSAGHPKVTIKSGTGTGEISLTSGVASANAVQISGDSVAADNLEAALDGTGGVSLTANVTGNLSGSVGSVTGAVGSVTGSVGSVAAGGITAASFGAGAIDAAALAADAGAEIADAVWDEATAGHTTSGTFGQRLASIRSGTAQAGGAGSITLDASASASDSFYNNTMLVITGGTGIGQSRIIESYTGATKVATVNPNWVTTPDATSVFVIIPFDDIPGASAPSAASIADAVWDEARSGHVSAGSFGEGVASVQGNVTGSVASVSGNVGGDVTGSVGSLAAQAKADVNAEVDTALSDINLDHLVGTATGIPAVPVGTYLDQIMDDGTAVYDRTTDSLQAIRDRGDAAWTEVSAAEIRSAVGLAAADLDAQLAAIDDYIDTEVAAIKAKTDQLTFTTPNQVDATAVTVGDKTGYRLSATGVDDVLDEPAVSLTGKPSTLRGLIWFVRQVWNNKHSYNKSTDSMVLYEDDGTTAKLTHAMVDDVNEATRGASST